ncbi:hypothetical protein LPJ56_003799 [Coemansia sp. RSA 2599]|nr:hypothetical protein LPJ56_003799 [Coemansia sp. RSA 2599]
MSWYFDDIRAQFYKQMFYKPNDDSKDIPACPDDVDLSVGKVVCFPSVYSCKTRDYKLKDKSKPAVVKMLAIHLVDPSVHMLSTSLVLPSQSSWAINDMVFQGTWINELTDPLKERIIGLANPSMTKEEMDIFYKKKIEYSFFNKDLEIRYSLASREANKEHGDIEKCV